MNAPIDCLCPREIALDLDASTRWEAFHAIGMLLERSRGLNAPPIVRALWRREQAQSTALGHGIALPHARIMRIREPITAYVRTRHPLAFAAPDRSPVSELFVILVPEAADHADHLELLALIAEMFSDSRFRSNLTAATDVAGIRSVFERWIGEREALAAAPATGATRPAPRASA
jgi:PTS system nitrogen regulatory IIA component